MNRLLEVQDLYKSYPSGEQSLEILSGLSLTINEGDMVGITGVSGSGKSTLLHLIGGMDRPDRGTIRILDKELASLNALSLAHYRNETVGFIFQFHHLLPEFTALENVMMPLLVRGISSREAERPAKELIQDVGLEARNHHRPGELSGGEQQRVALARALIGRPAYGPDHCDTFSNAPHQTWTYFNYCYAQRTSSRNVHPPLSSRKRSPN
jgi:lipoprotein-releasing system ATP-binding protein